jgi:hypothetical protein
MFFSHKKSTSTTVSAKFQKMHILKNVASHGCNREVNDNVANYACLNCGVAMLSLLVFSHEPNIPGRARLHWEVPKTFTACLERRHFFIFLYFFCEIELILVNFLHDFNEIHAFPSDPIRLLSVRTSCGKILDIAIFILKFHTACSLDLVSQNQSVI